MAKFDPLDCPFFYDVERQGLWKWRVVRREAPRLHCLHTRHTTPTIYRSEKAAFRSAQDIQTAAHDAWWIALSKEPS